MEVPGIIVVLFLIALWYALDRAIMISVTVDGRRIKVRKDTEPGARVYFTTHYPDGEVDTRTPVSDDVQRQIQEQMLSYWIRGSLNRLT
jgi:hypothetical protein